MLLSTLTPNELERLAYIDPTRPGVALAHAAACRGELADALTEIQSLEEEVHSLNSQLDDLANAD